MERRPRRAEGQARVGRPPPGPESPAHSLTRIEEGACLQPDRRPSPAGPANPRPPGPESPLVRPELKGGIMSTVVALAEARTGQELNVLDDAVKHG
ncbi:MAG: hypothetical protein AT711_08520 [Thermoproteus sp. CIS_19]|jgi:hypothetical protein|nr:MAG: hypothetical protein AT711_08520 [Thermoproteus sp. CIS_19]